MTTALSGGSLALAAGLIEAWYRWAGQPFSQRLPDIGTEIFWYAPAGMLLLTGPLIALVAFGRALLPRWVTLPRALFLLAVIPATSLSLVFLRERIPDWTHLLLGLGGAAVFQRLMVPRAPRFAKLARLAFPVLLAVPLLALVVILYWRPAAERRTVRALPAPVPGARNVVLIIWDTVRESELSLYGYDRETTPRVAARAGGGVVFERAYSPAPWTLPSHASMFTGFLMQELNTDWVTPLDASRPVFAEAFSGRGYRTGGFTANLMATTRPTGLSRGFQHYEDWPVTRNPRDVLHPLTLVRALRAYRPFAGLNLFRHRMKDAAKVTDGFLDWVDQGDGRPFLAFLNYFNAHEVYRAPAAFMERFSGRGTQDRYDAAIAYQDAEFERLWNALERRGILDGTIIVLASDHGEAFGEHGFVGHSGNLYVEQLHVPLVVWAPGRAPAGTRIATPVSLRDMGETLLDLAAAGVPRGFLAGRSLARFWEDSLAAGDTIVAGVHQSVNDPAAAVTQITAGDAITAIHGRHHYILTGTGREEIYDMIADSLELRDLAPGDSARPLLEMFREYLRRTVPPVWTARMPGFGGRP